MNDKPIIPQFDPDKTPQVQSDFYFNEYGLDLRNPDCPVKEYDSLRFEIAGGVNNYMTDAMRVTLKVARNPLVSPKHQYRRAVDLYNDDAVELYVRKAAVKLEVNTSVIHEPLYDLIERLERYRYGMRNAQDGAATKKRVVLSAVEEREALDFLQDTDLMEKLQRNLRDVGLASEESQHQGVTLFLVLLSRFFEKPSAAIIHGRSGSGKSHLMHTVLKVVLEKQVFTAVSANALYYPLNKNQWDGIVLAIEDFDGAHQALYPIRQLISEGRLSKVVAEPDKQTGKLVQRHVEVKARVAVVGTTTKERLYEDNSNRAFLLEVTSSDRHKQEVLDYQKRLMAGMIDLGVQKKAEKLLQNAQTLLEPVAVRIPFLPQLHLPKGIFKPLRTQVQFATLIRSIAFLHQKQLPMHHDTSGKPYIVATLDHLEIAIKYAHESLLRKADLLTGNRREFFELLKSHVRRCFPNNYQEVTFTAGSIREELRLHPQTLQRHIKHLVKMGLMEKVGTTPTKGRKAALYQIVNWLEYEELKQGMTVLDQQLERLRQDESFSNVRMLHPKKDGATGTDSQ